MKENNKDMNRPLISVIVPVYNVEKYLCDCIDSIIDQSYDVLEIILVDDGSTDRSGLICDEYKKKDARIKVIHKENGGLSDARNRGMDISKGEYIAFIDSDDHISPDYLKIMLHAIEGNRCQMAALANSTPFYDGEDVFFDTTSAEIKITIHDTRSALLLMLYQNIATGAPFKVCKRQIMEYVRFPEGYLYEDVATTYKEFLRSDKVAIVTGNLYAYRKRKDSITHQAFSEKKMIVITIRDQLINDKDIIKENLSEAASARAFQMIFNVFLQVPRNDKSNMALLWKYIRSDRRIVIRDKSPLLKKKIKAGAISSFLGMHATHFLGKLILHK